MIRKVADLAKKIIAETPLESLARKITRTERIPFDNSAHYWERRYTNAGTSGAGSYGRLADFKAEVVNNFVETHDIRSVIEFGCGDGNQLGLFRFPEYIGVDVSQRAVEMCRASFGCDVSKTFVSRTNYSGQRADLSLSLDVIYHLVEDDVFDLYMQELFAAGKRYVGIFSSNHTNDDTGSGHERHRIFTDWVDRRVNDFVLIDKVLNRYPFDPADASNTSLANFYFYERIDR